MIISVLSLSNSTFYLSLSIDHSITFHLVLTLNGI